MFFRLFMTSFHHANVKIDWISLWHANESWNNEFYVQNANALGKFQRFVNWLSQIALTRINLMYYVNGTYYGILLILEKLFNRSYFRYKRIIILPQNIEIAGWWCWNNTNLTHFYHEKMCFFFSIWTLVGSYMANVTKYEIYICIYPTLWSDRVWILPLPTVYWIFFLSIHNSPSIKLISLFVENIAFDN